MNMQNVNSEIKKFNPNREVSEEEKNLIGVKYALKRLNTNTNMDILSFKKMKTKLRMGAQPKKKMKTFVGEDRRGTEAEDKTTNANTTPRKMSGSPKKNTRYSNIFYQSDKEIADAKPAPLEKTFSLPLSHGGEMNLQVFE